jgi:hypothetical protein
VGCGVMAFIWGTVGFAVVGGVWWLVTGHPPVELAYWYLGFCLSVGAITLDFNFFKWREETRETANKVAELGRRLEGIERTLRTRN